MTNQTTAWNLLIEATIKAAVTISKEQGINKQKDFADRMTLALKATMKDNIEKVLAEWKEATEANLNNAWLQELMKTQAVELAQIAIKSIS